MRDHCNAFGSCALALCVGGASLWIGCSDDESVAAGGGAPTGTPTATSTGSGQGGSSGGGTTATGTAGAGATGGAGQGGAGGAIPSLPQVLATGTSPRSIALDATHLYWAGVGAHRVPKGGGAAEDLSLSGTGTTSYQTIAVDDTQLFLSPWISTTDRVWAAPKGGGAATLIATTLGVANSGDDLTVDGTHVYWLESSGAGRVGKVGKDGNGAVELASDLSGLTGIAVYGSDVYWSCAPCDAIKRVSTAGTNPATLADSEDAPSDVAVTSDGIFWVNRVTMSTSSPVTTGSVRRLEHGQSTPVSLATNQAGPHAIAVDDTHVYWTNFFDGTIKRVPIVGGAVDTVASLQGEPTDIAIDGTTIYWIDEEAGTIVRVAK
ncbi:MAG: hypothetical protein JRI23_02930 [Deltaproteobacteria bacterium]|jgi:hypothetical protein|nr:hypothetical protein [Deltaproteobacteria bacterium]MBW2530460.1 hypothetical protein [Deltaproteobacteria bacterium]